MKSAVKNNGKKSIKNFANVAIKKEQQKTIKGGFVIEDSMVL